VASQFGQRVVQTLLDDGEEAPKGPDYEAAEQEWAKGDYLEAIRLLREYLEKNPRAQHVALRIAEIYEKDLSNPLAAALEYEEVLKQKLPPERWGWAAIHLCNVYTGKLNQPQKGIDLLRRIVTEHGETAAAEKARGRLDQLADEGLIAPIAAASPSPSPESDDSKLPPGFAPKKR
jgi:tetratricopeptide (TPR) repeat protein